MSTASQRTHAPDGPTDVQGTHWKDTLKGLKRDNLTDWAAALTYYGILSVFPRCWRSCRSSA